MTPRSGQDKPWPSAISDSLDPLDSTGRLMQRAKARRATSWRVGLVLLAALVAFGITKLVTYSRNRTDRGATVSDETRPQILVPSAPAASIAIPPPPEAHAAEAQERERTASPAPQRAVASALPPLPHRERRVPPAKTAAAPSALAPAPRPEETVDSSTSRDNPFDRRF